METMRTRLLEIAATNEAVELEADANTKRNGGRALLYLAAEEGRTEVENLCGASVEGDDIVQTPPHKATTIGHEEIARLLVTKYGADANAKDKNGCTPLHMAAQCGGVEIARLLVTQFGADANAKDDEKLTPLHLASQTGHVELVRILASEFGADVHALSNNESIPLHYASKNGHVEIVRVLVNEFGANLNAKGENGSTPLQLAELHGHLEVVNLITNEFAASVKGKEKYSNKPLDESTKNAQAQLLQSGVLILDYLRPLNEINDCLLNKNVFSNLDTKQANSIIAKQSQEIDRLSNGNRCGDPVGGWDDEFKEKPYKKIELDEEMLWKVTAAVVSAGAVICIAWLLRGRIGSKQILRK